MADASYPERPAATTPSTTGPDRPGRSPTCATLGITWYAQDALGEVVFFEPPAVGTALTKDEPYAEVESVKAVSDVIAPLSGEIVEVNEALAEEPEQINDDPYGEGWLVKVRALGPLRDRGADGRRRLPREPRLRLAHRRAGVSLAACARSRRSAAWDRSPHSPRACGGRSGSQARLGVR